MRGASALGQVVTSHPEAPIRLLVVWTPVIDTDTGPPSDKVTAPLTDPRVRAFWDEGRILSPRIVERVKKMYAAGKVVPQVDEGDIIWDIIVSFEPGAMWEEPFPEPSWYAPEPVANSVMPIETRLRDLSPR